MKTKAVLSLVFGICGILLGAVPFLGFVTTVLSVIGIVFAVMALKSGDASLKGLAIGGLICSILGVVGGLPMAICTTVCSCAACEAGAAGGLAGLEGMLQ